MTPEDRLSHKRERQRQYSQEYRKRYPEKASATRNKYMLKARQDPERIGKLYFVQAASGPIKIGFTRKQPIGRLKELQVGNHEDLTLLLSVPGTMEQERQLHEELKPYLIRREWFQPAPEVLCVIEDLRQHTTM